MCGALIIPSTSGQGSNPHHLNAAVRLRDADTPEAAGESAHAMELGSKNRVEFSRRTPDFHAAERHAKVI